LIGSLIVSGRDELFSFLYLFSCVCDFLRSACASYTMCYTGARKIAEGLALPAQNGQGVGRLPRGLPRLVTTLPPRGHGRGVPVQPQPVLTPGRGALLDRWLALNRRNGPSRGSNSAALMEAVRRGFGRSPPS